MLIGECVAPFEHHDSSRNLYPSIHLSINPPTFWLLSTCLHSNNLGWWRIKLFLMWIMRGIIMCTYKHDNTPHTVCGMHKRIVTFLSQFDTDT